MLQVGCSFILSHELETVDATMEPHVEATHFEECFQDGGKTRLKV